MVNKIIKTIILILIAILISIASFYIYFATQTSVNLGFSKLGITNIWLQVVIVIVGVLILITLMMMLIGRKVDVFDIIKDIFRT